MDEISENVTQIQNDEDEISLIDLFAVLWRRKWMIIGITCFAMIAVVIYCVISLKLPPEKSYMPNEYEPTAHMLINDNSSSSSGLSSMLNSSGLGGLASLAGISASSGSSFTGLAKYYSQSNPYLDAIIDEFDMMDKTGKSKSPRSDARDSLREALKIDIDSSSVLTISYSSIDPYKAQQIVNFATDKMEEFFMDMGLDKNLLEKKNLEENIKASYDEIISLQKKIQNVEHSVSDVYNPSSAPSIMLETQMLKLELSAQQQVYTQLKSQYEVLKISMASETPIFQVLEKAEIPDRKSGPSRGKLCIIVTFAAGFMSVFLAFLLNALENIKKDPVAMGKLKGKKHE